MKRAESRFFYPVLGGFAAVIPIIVIIIALPVQPLMAANEDSNAGKNSPAGLLSVTSSMFDELYIHPDADFSKYRSVLIEDASVSFVSRWMREHRDVLSRREVERIRNEMAGILKQVLTEKLSEDNGYRVVKETADGTLRIRPEIVEMNLYAPDAGHRATLVHSAGYATLVLQIYDAGTGQLLAKIVDYRMSDGAGGGRDFYVATRTSNAHEFRQIMSIWAGRVREQLDIMQK